jgi:succinate dehydrogenase / fumarate reductase flavoprotein subunit
MSSIENIKGYPKYLREIISKIEKTRDQRLNEPFPLMNLKERESLLKLSHPDYKKKTKRPIRIGPNKGDLMPHEVVDLLEAHSLIKPEKMFLSEINFDIDILIIGGGGAGMTAALWANYSGIESKRILIIQKLRLGDSNSIMSQGGVQAADKPNDNPSIHYIDVLGGGHFTNNPQLVRRLVIDGPKIMDWHQKLGITYDKKVMVRW